jgi:tRNA modification GTPase
MHAFSSDTIAAKATPPGKGGVGIIRISGQEAPKLALELLGVIPEPRKAMFSGFKASDGNLIDQGLALYFKKPNSFTGEDVLELHGHGGTVVMDLLLQRVIGLGARLARPGEFSERAFLNNKIDLAQAEAIADLIEASSAAAARSAIQSLQGHFSEEVTRLVEQVTALRMYVEAAIDFPEEEVDFLSDGNILVQLQNIILQLNKTLDRTRQGAALNEGLRVVIVGHPNAGKSSLLNYLSGEQTAIVSDQPGTTRDVLKEDILIDGMPLRLIDTAGLRDSSDQIEAEGVRRAFNEVSQADRVLLVVDASETETDLERHELVKKFSDQASKLIILRNKIDLTNDLYSSDTLGYPVINVSAKTGQGITELKEHLKSCIGFEGQETVYLARRRHLDALNRANSHFENAQQQLLVYQAGELVAEELRQAQNVLGEITGEFRSDDLLGKIFSTFCIGK